MEKKPAQERKYSEADIRKAVKHGFKISTDMNDTADSLISVIRFAASKPPEAPIDDCDFCHGTREYEVNVNGADVPVECSFCKEEANQRRTPLPTQG